MAFIKAIWVLILTFIGFTYSFDNKKLCTSTCPAPIKDSPLIKFCAQGNSTGHLEQLGSCCLNNSMTGSLAIIGLDFSSCSLHDRSDRNSLFKGLSNLNLLMLENNTNLQLPEEAFYGLTVLQNLTLPVTMRCPGGNRSWLHEDFFPDKLLCYDEINLCLDKNVTCPNGKSHCVFLGPGLVECQCNTGFYGYKCLRQGTFPSVVYTIILCVCTVVLAGGLWCIQRRKIKRH